jgi:SAM-dependent methyltransferase
VYEPLRRAARRLSPTARFSPRPTAQLPDWSTEVPFPQRDPVDLDTAASCVICRWRGPAFAGAAHCESSVCPCCGSIARDRFLFWCFLATNPTPGIRVLETSPRLDDRYRAAMRGWFEYRCSDFDERAHRGTIRLDLQAMDLPDESVDVLLTPHVLEHVPDTDRALQEIHRVLAPGGRMLLQVPLLQGHTAPPTEPEFHEDHTPVFWRFGWDLTSRLRHHGFATTVLVTDEWLSLVDSGATSWPDGSVSPEFDVASMLAAADRDDFRSVANPLEAHQIGAVPAYMFSVWECIKRVSPHA